MADSTAPPPAPAITAEWLATHMAGLAGRSVRDVVVTPLTGGYFGTVNKVSCVVGDAPLSVVVKQLPSAADAAAVAGQVRSMQREALAYEVVGLMAADSAAHFPTLLHSDRSTVVLSMVPGRPVTPAYNGLSLDDTRRVLRVLAELHAMAFAPASGDIVARLDAAAAGTNAFITAWVDVDKLAADLFPTTNTAAGGDVAAYVRGYSRADCTRDLDGRPWHGSGSEVRGVNHGDVWTGNILRSTSGDSGSLYLLDLQFASVSPVVQDIAMVLNFATDERLLTPDVERACVQEYATAFRAAVCRHGVEVPPGVDTLWEAYTAAGLPFAWAWVVASYASVADVLSKANPEAAEAMRTTMRRLAAAAAAAEVGPESPPGK